MNAQNIYRYNFSCVSTHLDFLQRGNHANITNFTVHSNRCGNENENMIYSVFNAFLFIFFSRTPAIAHRVTVRSSSHSAVDFYVHGCFFYIECRIIPCLKLSVYIIYWLEWLYIWVGIDFKPCPGNGPTGLLFSILKSPRKL